MIAFAAAAWLFLAGVVVQVFLAGLSVFELTNWTGHAGFGWLLSSASLILLLLAFLARADTRTRWLALLLVVSALVQPELASARKEVPVLAALHPVNAMLLFWLAWMVAGASLRELRGADQLAAGREPSAVRPAPSHDAAPDAGP